MTRKTLTYAAAVRIKELYAEADEFGRRLYTQMDIAKMMGVGETTVYRAIHSAGSYETVREPAGKAEAEESLRRFKERFPELLPQEGSGLEKLAALAAERNKGNEMIEEIIGKDPLDE